MNTTYAEAPNSANMIDTECNEITGLDAGGPKLYNEDEVRRMIEAAVADCLNEIHTAALPSTDNLENFKGHMGRGGTDNMYATMPLSAYIRQWLDTFKANSVKSATYNRLESSYNTMLTYDISSMPLAEITAIDIQRYVNELTDHGYTISTIKKQLQIVTAPLRQAAAMHLIPTDPTVSVRLPKETMLKKQTHAVLPYTEEEQERLWKVIDASAHPGVLAVGFMLETGLRAGELMALRWEKVDIPNKRIRVEATITDPVGNTKAAFQPSPKTKSSTRTVPLTPRAISVLERLKGRSDEWVFPGRSGKWISYLTLSSHIKWACEKADVPYRGAHACRHTFATNCYYRHDDVKILSKLLGHSSIDVTMNIYVTLHGDGFDEMYAALVG